MDFSYKLHTFRRYSVITFNNNCPLHPTKEIINDVINKRPSSLLYVEVEDDNWPIKTLLRKGNFSESADHLHIYRDNWRGFQIDIPTFKEWIIKCNEPKTLKVITRIVTLDDDEDEDEEDDLDGWLINDSNRHLCKQFDMPRTYAQDPEPVKSPPIQVINCNIYDEDVNCINGWYTIPYNV